MKYTRDQVRRAAANLSGFVVDQAYNLRLRSCIEPLATPYAPDNYNALMLAYHQAKLVTGALPVSNLHCDRTIYTTPECNVMFRYWHDMLHCQMGHDFSLRGELAVGAYHCACAADRFGKDSLEYKLMVADTIGQTVYESINGSFPADQWEFCSNFVNQ